MRDRVPTFYEIHSAFEKAQTLDDLISIADRVRHKFECNIWPTDAAALRLAFIGHLARLGFSFSDLVQVLSGWDDFE